MKYNHSYHKYTKRVFNLLAPFYWFFELFMIGLKKKICLNNGNTLDAKLIKPCEVDLNALQKYDLIGFGSGIYFCKHYKNLLELVNKLPSVRNKKIYLFIIGIILSIFVYLGLTMFFPE